MVLSLCNIEGTLAICKTFFDIKSLNTSHLISNLKILSCEVGNGQMEEFRNLQLPYTITNLTLEDCNLKNLIHIPKLHKNVTMLNIAKNNISIIPWQFVSFDIKKLDLDIRWNYLACLCENEWILSINQDIKTFFSLPDNIYVNEEFKKRCKNMKCVREDIKSISYQKNVSIGDEVNLICLVNNSIFNENFYKQTYLNYFRWITISRSNNNEKLANDNYEQFVDIHSNAIKLRIKHATDNDLGVLACLCLWCKYPSFSFSEIRIKKNLTINAFNDGRSEKLIVQGYPLDNLTFKITRLRDYAEEEPFYISEITKSLFNNTLFLKQESSQEDITNFYIRDLRVFPKECTLCNETTWDLVNKEYEMNLCNSEGNCAKVKRYLGALNHSKRKGRNYEVHSNKINIKTDEINNQSTYFTNVISVMAILFMILSAVYIFKYRKLIPYIKKRNQLLKHYSRRTSKTEETILQQTQSNVTRGNSVSMSMNSSDYCLKHVPIIDVQNIELGRKIGQGAYGEVYYANWIYQSTGNDDPTCDPLLKFNQKKKEIAVKTLKNLTFNADWDREAGLLSQLDHNNVVKFYGIAYSEKNEALIVMEYMNLGDLRNYLKKRAPPLTMDYSQFPPTLQTSELIEISKQICEGVSYLTTRQIVHRDIAARNCLVSGDSDMMICDYRLRSKTTIKISDFGMSRKLYSDVEYYKMGCGEGKLLPCRWLGPECLSSGKFSHCSDVWSLGITIWEVFAYGEIPFKHLNNNEIFSAISMGVRPELPKGAPVIVGKIIEGCLKEDPEERISAIDCLTQLNLI
uniref:Protein kinase domain-containing protein n=1 Tax=Parastrongyloides trichosuri TaxID=131310 RepID=A0A0N4ZSM8_PARTI